MLRSFNPYFVFLYFQIYIIHLVQTLRGPPTWTRQLALGRYYIFWNINQLLIKKIVYVITINTEEVLDVLYHRRVDFVICNHGLFFITNYLIKIKYFHFERSFENISSPSHRKNLRIYATVPMYYWRTQKYVLVYSKWHQKLAVRQVIISITRCTHPRSEVYISLNI